MIYKTYSAYRGWFNPLILILLLPKDRWIRYTHITLILWLLLLLLPLLSFRYTGCMLKTHLVIFYWGFSFYSTLFSLFVLIRKSNKVESFFFILNLFFNKIMMNLVITKKKNMKNWVSLSEIWKSKNIEKRRKYKVDISKAFD